MQPELSIIIVHYGSPALTETLVSQLTALPPAPSREIIVVDNAAELPFPSDRHPGVRTVRLAQNRGYGFACNRGADAARGAFLLVCNNDLELRGNPLAALTERCAQQPSVGAVGPLLRFPDGRFQLSWGNFPSLRSEFLERRRQRQSRSGGGGDLRRREEASADMRTVDWVTGACVLLPRKAWNSVRGFDERYFFYFEDVDLCMRLRRQGWDILYDPSVEVLHHGGGSDPLRNPAIVLSYRREQLRYYARYNSALSFALLRRYLRWKFRRMRAAGAIDAALAGEVQELISSFSRKEERRQFHASEKGIS
jgi:GT2 family glycosyltransferase